MANEYKSEKVTFTPSPLNNGEFIPRIAIAISKNDTQQQQQKTVEDPSEENARPFRGDDMPRVLDFGNMPEPPPQDTALGHLEFELDDDDTISDRAPPRFPKRFFCLRGSFIFYFDLNDVNLNNNAGGAGGGGQMMMHTNQPMFKAAPLGVIPLEKTVVEFPPGGRRVFREHAMTEARNGYEMMIRHVARLSSATTSDANAAQQQKVKRRAPAYLVMDGLNQREFWAKAIRIRADVYKKDTTLRAGGTTGQSSSANHDGSSQMLTGDMLHGDLSPEAGMMTGPGMGAGGNRRLTRRHASNTSPDNNRSSPERRGKIGGKISVLAGVMESEEQKDVEDALIEFGKKDLFEETKWVESFYEKNDEYEAPSMCRTLERWQGSIKKGLRGAVLEQYEYFVEASREMTIMGREVASLKDLVNKQVETIENMKNVEFDLDYVDRRPGFGEINNNGDYKEDDDEYSFHEDEDEEEADISFILAGKSQDNLLDTNDSMSWDQDSSSKKQKKLGRVSTAATTRTPSKRGIQNGSKKDRDAELIQMPDWLEDATEEIAAFINQCRYTDATELLFKARAEAMDTLNLHEKLTDKKLSRKQQIMLYRILRSLDHLTDRMCHRLSEVLRRKNEALKQAAKKERADPLSALAPLVSPVALNDDVTPLILLVKLGRAQDAATAYAARRSLLLTECLLERPICNITTANNNDIVIYAAQLSHSFFSCLATSVEGFLDLFMDGEKGPKDDMSDASSTIQSTEKSALSSASALAAVTLWCDSELAKFSATFGTKVLGNLSLSPRQLNTANNITDRITKFEVVADLSHLRKQLRAAEEMGEYTAAGKIRKKIAIQEMEEKEGKTLHRVQSPKASDDDERKLAVKIASKCVDQAFEFATECLNAIGLPVTPRLAEYLRPRLKGAEADIAMKIEERWEHIIFDWKDLSSGPNEAERQISPTAFTRNSFS